MRSSTGAQITPRFPEGLQCQRVEHNDDVIEMVTCPNETAALSIAHGSLKATMGLRRLQVGPLQSLSSERRFLSSSFVF
ncbi:hypothetical protein M405DRAFT_828830 [Rhizopogon salebrosus TDB-379]|nr:hypothetical protein M405DRAFT_828830 [Rhizopogon salebrosus TDB-379]